MTLFQLAKDPVMKDLKDYFEKVLKEKAIEKVFAKEDTSAVAEAKEIIDQAFENIEVQFAPKAELKKVINEAR